jgi:hypothetical protein
VGTAGAPSTNALTVQQVTIGNGTSANAARVTLSSDSTGTVIATQGTAANLNATVVGTGTFVAQVNPSTPNSWGLSATGAAVPTVAALMGMNQGGNNTALTGSGGSLNVGVTNTPAVTQSGVWSVRTQDGSGAGLTSATRGAQQALSVQIVDAAGNQITAFGSSGGTSIADNHLFTQSTTSETPIGCLFNTSYAAATSGNSTIVSCTAAGSVHTTVDNANVNISTNADAVATGTSNVSPVGAFLFGFNGSTFDRLRVDGNKNLLTNTTLSPATTGGLTNFVIEPAASDNHTNIKNGAGQVYGIHVFNNSATINYGRLYNAGTGFNGCASATNLLYEFHIPASTSDAGFVVPVPQGLAFGNGISLCVTGAYGQTSTTAATASAISLNVLYN